MSRDQGDALLILVQTAVTHFSERQQVRDTWKRECEGEPYCGCIFIAGRSKIDAENRALRREADQHQDVLQVDVVDAYANLTLKTMFSIR